MPALVVHRTPGEPMPGEPMPGEPRTPGERAAVPARREGRQELGEKRELAAAEEHLEPVVKALAEWPERAGYPAPEGPQATYACWERPSSGSACSHRERGGY